MQKYDNMQTEYVGNIMSASNESTNESTQLSVKLYRELTVLLHPHTLLKKTMLVPQISPSCPSSEEGTLTQGHKCSKVIKC